MNQDDFKYSNYFWGSVEGFEKCAIEAGRVWRIRKFGND
jgi:hypothetical protein